MRFVTVRDLRNKPAQIRRSLLEEKDIVLTSNGKSFAIVTLTSEDTLKTWLDTAYSGRRGGSLYAEALRKQVRPAFLK